MAFLTIFFLLFTLLAKDAWSAPTKVQTNGTTIALAEPPKSDYNRLVKYVFALVVSIIIQHDFFIFFLERIKGLNH